MISINKQVQTIVALTMSATISTGFAATTFVERFDGNPASPVVFESPNWDVALMTRDRSSWVNVNPGNIADHGADCSPPPASRTIQLLEETVFRCKHHLMTAMNEDSFGVVTLTPNHMLDLTAAESRVSFDLSTARKGGYDWIEIMLTPYDDNLVHPASDFWQVAGPPRNAIQIAMTPGTDNNFTLIKYANGSAETYQFCDRCDGVDFWTSYGTSQLPLVPDKKRRENFELLITDDGRISFGVKNYFNGVDTSQSFLWLDEVDISPLNWTTAVVQLQHFSFNPTNNCGNTSCDGETWHWDNVEIEPAVAFTIIPSTQRYVDPQLNTNTRVQFQSVSAENSHVRFSAIGHDMELSVDGGATWQLARLQNNAENSPALEGRFRNYFHPIPAGISEVEFRGAQWWGGDWHVRDISIWAR